MQPPSSSTTKPQLEKSQLRSAVLKELSAISTSEKNQMSAKIQQRLQEKLHAQSGLWSAFQALPSEPKINWNEVSPDIQWCFPVLENETMQFKKLATKFSTNSLGFSEPSDGQVVAIEEIKGAILPGIAFDSQGHRLGRGRGYYDKTFKNMKGSLIGVCFQTALVNEVPTEEHDLKCHIVITENKSVVIEGARSWN